MVHDNFDKIISFLIIWILEYLNYYIYVNKKENNLNKKGIIFGRSVGWFS